MEAVIAPWEGQEPVIDPEAFVAPNTTVIGDVHIGSGSGVFYGTVVRADRSPIRMGDGSNLQDNCTVHSDPEYPCTIGSGVSVGHAAVLHGCTVEDNVLIGMSATVLNGAVIGAGSLVAAGAVVLEGTVIPPGSLVAGVPAKVRRELTAQEQQQITVNAQTYLRLSAGHRALHS
ncbi:gamma carbonic anhydrase family protein [Kocuria sp.]|uniref:gamma carbonic anhydrase family protein n=1 Tax=Kocuria sp. TaxID=1871328 RepID=UPI0026E001DD|nr:gamma carbonic anhydrase family protein [Kocuria sp.]MDO5617572.1 gamma carbonic anhydrase family protein [Kocuria sp.]